jgi:hypothetical protein
MKGTVYWIFLKVNQKSSGQNFGFKGEVLKTLAGLKLTDL